MVFTHLHEEFLVTPIMITGRFCNDPSLNLGFLSYPGYCDNSVSSRVS